MDFKRRQKDSIWDVALFSVYDIFTVIFTITLRKFNLFDNLNNNMENY